MTARQFDADWSEEATLRDGTRVVMRCVRPSDKALLERGFAHLSPSSRFRRFFAAKHHLTSKELRYLTEPDGEDHVAIGALRPHPAGNEGLGVARFVRLVGEPEVAEAAGAVVDAYHGRGLGRLLLRRLISAAVEREVHWFRAMVLADNHAAFAMLRGLSPHLIEVERDDTSITVDVPLEAAQKPELWEELWKLVVDLLRLVAKQALDVRAVGHLLRGEQPGDGKAGEG